MLSITFICLDSRAYYCVSSSSSHFPRFDIVRFWMKFPSFPFDDGIAEEEDIGRPPALPAYLSRRASYNVDCLNILSMYHLMTSYCRGMPITHIHICTVEKRCLVVLWRIFFLVMVNLICLARLFLSYVLLKDSLSQQHGTKTGSPPLTALYSPPTSTTTSNPFRKHTHT